MNISKRLQMKKTLRSIFLLMAFALTFSFISYAETFEVIQKDPTKKYFTGHILNLNDYYFSFDGEQVDSSQVMVHGFDSSTPGYKTITFTYKGFSYQLPVNVELQEELKVIPKEASYPIGYTLSQSDFIVSMGDRAITTFSIHPVKIASTGYNSILITAESKTTSVSIYGEDSTFNLSISGNYKTEFFENETITTQGVVVSKIDNKGNVTDVTRDTVIEVPKVDGIGDYIVTATYKGVVATYRIVVKESSYMGMDTEMLNVDGTVKLMFSNGTEEIVYPHTAEDLSSGVKVITATDSHGNTYTEVIPLPEGEVIQGKQLKRIVLQVPIGLNVTSAYGLLNPVKEIEFKNGSQAFVKVHSVFREVIAGIQDFFLEFKVGANAFLDLQLERVDTPDFYLPIDSELEVSHE